MDLKRTRCKHTAQQPAAPAVWGAKPVAVVAINVHACRTCSVHFHEGRKGFEFEESVHLHLNKGTGGGVPGATAWASGLLMQQLKTTEQSGCRSCTLIQLPDVQISCS